nr:MAG TPA: hypothetical protein [Crassvirales sp.]
MHIRIHHVIYILNPFLCIVCYFTIRIFSY